MNPETTKPNSEATNATIKGFTCECGRLTEFAPIIFANWNRLFRSECACGKKFIIKSGTATEVSNAEFKKWKVIEVGR